MIYQEKCKIAENKKIAPNYNKIAFYSKNIHKKVLPGQFVHILIPDYKNLGIFLRRPFSIHDISSKGFSIIYHIIGKGTKTLSTFQPNNKIALDIIGPLGNGFKIYKNKIAVLIAGGCGAAPLYLLEKQLKEKGIESIVFLGATTKKLLLCTNKFLDIKSKLHISTDDGSYGEKCIVTTLSYPHIKYLDPKKTVIYACGPQAMLKAISKFAIKENFKCQVSLEEYMACGVGACLGCVVATKKGNKRVCKDGPVFDAKEILWQ